jgi:hypothetical protein
LADSALAADHLDLPRTPAGAEIARPDASMTDFHVFTTSGKFVMVMNINPFLDPQLTSYRSPTDVSYRFNIDVDSPVTMGDDVATHEFGGTVNNPAAISEDIVFEIKFDSTNKPRLTITGSNRSQCDTIRAQARVFAGLRAESFIFAPFARNNVASIVVEVPLTSVLRRQTQLLTWATTTVATPSGPFTEIAGRALRSQFPPFIALNGLHPRQHAAAGFVRPDVVIIDVRKPTEFPNGRALSDDVIDIIGTFTLLPTDPSGVAAELANCAPGGSDFPCPVPASATADDVRILGRFPYLGRPFTFAERLAAQNGDSTLAD